MVHLLPTPTRGGRVLIDADTLLVVDCGQLPPIGERSRVLRSDAVERQAVGSEKAQRAVIEALDHDSALVHLSVMKAAELHKVRKLRFPTLSPMVDVMPIHGARDLLIRHGPVQRVGKS